MFSVRAVSLDYYTSKPIDEIYNKEEQHFVKEWQEPVLRIFGPTADGFKCCVHIHGVYPYIYVPYKGGENAERDALLLGRALDEALKTSLNPKIFRFVHKVTLISGIPLYGYHSKHRQFFKIYFYNPFHIKKASDLLLSGAILGQKFQPHEAHIPYALQFMMDYNIYGMSFVNFSKVKFRRNPANPESLKDISAEDIFSEKVKKITWSRLEVDAWASDILNRIGEESIGVNPGLQAIWKEEQDRRRAQNRSSQITLQQSQSRPIVNTHPTEALYKAQLAQKLAEISHVETGASFTSEEPTHSYPAEVPENRHLLEASAIEEGVESPLEKETVGDVSSLIDEKILSQMSGIEKEKKDSESEDEMEFDSVLGRNQKPIEEAEPEDEEGVDMTQPLDPDEELICGAEGDRRESGCDSEEGEDTFWKNMADKIFQLDGAQESSSESDAEAGPSGSAPGHGFSDGGSELSSDWSTNIMSILSECSECPTPSAPCPTPRTFWFDYSSDLLTQNHDPWSKNAVHFSDFPGKNQDGCLDGDSFPGASKDLVSGEPFNDLYVSNGGDYFPTSLLCNTESTISLPPTVLAPSSETSSSGINLDSVCGDVHSPLKEKSKLPSLDGKFSESKLTLNGKPENDHQKVLQVLKSFSGRKVPLEDNSGHLTLKQYIKDCKEIVSVDFKNLCNREMVIIEYKSQNKRNKYLIKPLEKFLESWNSAERKANDRKEGDEVKEFESEKNLRSNYVINVLEKRFSDASTVQSMSNKLTVKSMEILPDGGNYKDRCYNVNENVISRGEIKMKLIKSQRENVGENLVGGALKRRRSEKCQRYNLKTVETGNEKVIPKRKSKAESGENVGSDRKSGKCKKWKNFPKPDAKLINEINSSFEEYFKSIVKHRNIYRKRKKNVDKVTYEEEEEEEETSEEEVAEEPPTGKRSSQELCTSSNTDPIKFVTRFLSTFSEMTDVPPLSITIRLGNSRDSVPVKVNLRPSVTTSDKEVKYRSKKRGRKTKIENVDGPADDSSSEESASSDPRIHPRGQGEPRRSCYKPLNVFAHGGPREKARGGRKRKMSGTEGDEAASHVRKGGKSFSVEPSRDRFVVFREKPKSWPPRRGKEEKVANRSLVKRKKTVQSTSQFSADVKTRNSESDSGQELDFIADSDEERKFKRTDSKDGSSKRQKKSSRAFINNIPQADTEAAFTSDDETQPFPEKVSLPSESQSETLDKRAFDFLNDPSPNASENANAPLELEPKDSSFPEAPSEQSILYQMASSGSQSLGTNDLLEVKTQNVLSPQPGTSFGMSSSTKRLDTQIPLSPFTLSGSPLFGSVSNSPEPYLSGSSTSETLTHSKREMHSPRSSGSSRSLKFSSGKQYLGFSSSDPAGAESVQSGDAKDSIGSVVGSKIIKPKRNPLSRKQVVETMQRYDIVESEEKAPFYGNPLDVTKAMDTGFKMPKIQNRSVAGLRSFKSSLDILGVEERRNALPRGQKVPRWELIENKDSTITPLIKPPSREMVQKNLLTKDETENPKKESEKARLKIINPSSPGQEMKSDEEMEFSVTMSNFSVEGGSCDADKSTGFSSPVTELEPNLKSGPSGKVKGTLSVPKETGGDGQTTNSSSLVLDGSDASKQSKRSSKGDNSFQIRGVTVDNTFGFSNSVENMENAKLGVTHQYMSMLVMEVHVQTRKDLRPNPEQDPIRALFYAMAFDSPTEGRALGAIVVGEGFLSGTAPPDLSIHYVPTEKALFEKFLSLVREWDPEILTGYEIEMHSWGYLVQRGFVLEMNLLLLLGRVQTEDFARKNSSDLESLGDGADDVPRNVRHMRISGRIVLDAWRVLRHEVALTSYTFENVMYHLSHERHPLLSYEKLSYYWEHPFCRFRHLVVEHFTTRILGLIKILDQLDFIGRTSELSRLFGIQFYEVLSRGSQFRVESMMLRLAKPLNYVPASPSVSQRASMRAPASLPLILEPESLFYTDPVVVLDFQSLYPSIIIAYNYCFSTCLGRVEKLGGREPFEFGCTQLQISPEELKNLEKDINISPAGVAFVRSNVRKGVLPSMLEKILETRLMVKKSMKENKENKVLQKVLFARQLGLKLIANVTYGYTAANFSGRMPCIEVGDSVVSKGRETLHRAIQLVKNTREWGARVVYGDTDSIFVLLPGRTRKEAFKIGAEIAEAVTRDNPKPVKLKLEKVYQPCILQTKKRYVGYMFESPDQRKPAFEAKGIETVRRDGCPATGKILEKALRILFDTRDVSLVKKYTLRQFSKLYQGRVNVQDLIFAKEYRGRSGYRPGACVPALQLAKQWTQYDKRAEPRVKERVPYVIVNGPPGVPLIRLVRSPADLISDPSLRINAAYYITKAIIPPMQRCFTLLGVDVRTWYTDMPRKPHKIQKWSSAEGQKRSTISQYFATLECVVCSEITTAPVCQKCEKKPQVLAVILNEKIRRGERCHDGLREICRSCCGRPAELDCVSLDCPVLFRRKQAERAEQQKAALREISSQYLCLPEADDFNVNPPTVS